MPGYRWQRTIVDNEGNVLPGAEVEFRDEQSGALVSLFTDRDLTVNAGNPIVADANGFAFAYMEPARLRITATSGAFTQEWRDYLNSEGPLGSSALGAGSDLLSYTGTGQTVTEALNKRNFFGVGSEAGLENIIGPQDGWQASVAGESPSIWQFSEANLSSEVALNPFKYLAPSGEDGSLGAWVKITTEAIGENILINGGFDIAQRGVSFPAIAHFTPTIDRWRFGQLNGSAIFTVSREDDSPTDNSRFSLKAEVTTADASPGADDEGHIRYAFEGRESGLRIANKVVTLSFWVKSNNPGDYSIALVKPNSAGTAEETYLQKYTVLVADTWEKKEITIDLSSSSDNTWRLDNNYALKLRFSYYAGVNFSGVEGWQSGNFVQATGSTNLAETVGNYLQIAEVKFESGAIATDYVSRSINDELELCERYFTIIGSQDLDSVGITGYSGAIGETAYQTIRYPVFMRDQPTVTLETFEVGNSGQPEVLAGTNSLTLKITSTATGRFAVRSDTAARPISLDAEL